MFWTADHFATSLVWQCIFISWSVLWKGCFPVFKVTVTVKVRNCSECLSRQYLWSNKLNMVMHHHPEYHLEIFFCYFQGQVHNHFYCIFRNTETLQSELVWWYIITRQGKTQWKDFIAFTQGIRQRVWPGWLWTKLMPLLAILISQAGVNTSSNQENVDRTLLL